MLRFHGVDTATIGVFGKRWILGSSPRMTTRRDAANYFLLKTREAAFFRQPLFIVVGTGLEPATFGL